MAPTVCYRLFGLTVASELRLPLPAAGDPSPRPGASPAAVEIVLGPVAAAGDLLWRDAPPIEFACYRAGEAIVLDWPSARFLVSAERVVVDTDDRAVAADLVVAAVWAVVLSARGRESLHGSAVARAGRALAVLGCSGAGKTTASLALLDRGWGAVTDDLLAFDSAGRVLPGPPFVRLCPDRAHGRRGRVDSSGKLRYRAPAIPAPLPLAAIVVLGERHETRARLAGVAAAGALLEQVYNPILTYPDQARRRFEMVLGLVDRVPVFVAPPRSLTADDLERIVEETAA